MPIFDYECEKCKTRIEIFQRNSEPTDRLCEEEGCDGRLNKKMSVFKAIYKGSGFYATDYK